MNKTQLEQMGACAVNAAKSLQTATAQQKNIFFEDFNELKLYAGIKIVLYAVN